MSLTRVVLVGAPNTDKQSVAEGIRKSNSSDFWFDREPYSSADLNGPLTDYRTELLSSLERAKALAPDLDQLRLFVHSPLDNLAYTCVISADSIGVDERTAHRLILTGATTYAIVQDSFKADLIFFLPYQGEQTEDGFTEKLDELYPDLLAEFGLEYVTLTGSVDEKIEQAIREVEERLASDTDRVSSATQEESS